jgi:hypothetical protein
MFLESLWNFFLLLQFSNISSSTCLPSKSLTQLTTIECLLSIRYRKANDTWCQSWPWTPFWTFQYQRSYSTSRWRCPTAVGHSCLKLSTDVRNVDYHRRTVMMSMVVDQVGRMCCAQDWACGGKNCVIGNRVLRNAHMPARRKSLRGQKGRSEDCRAGRCQRSQEHNGGK